MSEGPRHLLLFHDALFIIRKASPEGRRPAYSFMVSLGKSQVEVCERRGKSFIKYFKGPFIKMLLRDQTHLMAIPFTCKFRLRAVSYFSFRKISLNV